jgi:cytochrome c-type biogenesis protein CcmH
MTSLWLGITLLLLIAILFIAISCRSKKITFALGAFIIISSLSLYYYLGNSQGLRNAILLQAFNNQEEVLPELLQGLQKQLKQHPNDPVTLTLLGKIYFSLGDYIDASSIYAKAYALAPDDTELLIDYVTADFLAKDGKLDPQLSELLAQVEKLKPSIESLSLLANVAIASGNTELAIQYWQQMQSLVPKDSPLYQELTATIAFARSQ